MNHKLRTLAFRTLELLPHRVGDYFYHQFQNAVAKPVEVEYASQLDTIDRFVRVAADLGLTLEGKRIVELGSGWLPVLPYEFLFKHRAKEVLTFDINAHYQARNIQTFSRFFGRRNGVSVGDVLPDPIRYFPRTNILERSDLRDIDVLVTRNVLEHVRPTDLQLIHQQAYLYLRKDGFIIHQISPSDHRAYTDRKLSLWDFLKFSQSEWDKIQTRFDFHNRLRLPQYLEIFKMAGFGIDHLSFKPARAGQELPEIIHEDFKKFTREELTAGNIVVVLKPVRR